MNHTDPFSGRRINDQYKNDDELFRRQMTAEINAAQAERQQMEQKHGKVWDTAEMTQEFSVQGFMAPFVVVKRKSDGVRGALMFQHSPRFYFGFEEEG